MSKQVQAWQANDGQLFITEALMLEHESATRLAALNQSWIDLINGSIPDYGETPEYALHITSDADLDNVIEFLQLERKARGI